MERATRHSKKRDAILEAIRHTDCHPSAEWVYQTLKPEHPNLSLGTVYRNLLFFQEQGEIKSVGVVKGQERFDGNVAPHSHFICGSCGSVIDLHKLKPDGHLDDTVREEYQFSVQRHELTFYGKCLACMQKNNDQEELLV